MLSSGLAHLLSRTLFAIAIITTCSSSSRHGQCRAFTTLPLLPHHRTGSSVTTRPFALSHTRRHRQSTVLAAGSANADFEWQEMKVQLDAMRRSGVASRDLPFDKRNEIASYVSAILRKRPSPVALSPATAPRLLVGTRWRLGFSTQAATLGDLPRDATVALNFLDETTLEYCLLFDKTLALQSLKATCQWLCDEQGIITFVYEKITTDLFGLRNIGVGFFGLLKGRANFVETGYFDGQFWIEGGIGIDGQTVFYNVYVREQ